MMCVTFVSSNDLRAGPNLFCFLGEKYVILINCGWRMVDILQLYTNLNKNVITKLPTI